MGEIIVALVMVLISLGPLPKGKNLDSTPPQFTIGNLKNVASDPADIIWNPEPGLKKTTMTHEGVTITSFYDKHNALLGTTRKVDIAALPPIAINNLVKDFPGYQMGDIVEFTREEITYFITLKNNQENFLVKVNPENEISYFKSLP